MSLDDMFMAQHDQPCDCAVCDDISFRRSVSKGFMSIAEVNEHEKLLRDEFDEALGKIARLQVDLHQTVVDCERYQKALEQIASQPLEPAHIYEIADRIKLIAKVALEI